MLTFEKTIIDALILLGLAVVEIVDPPKKDYTGVKMGVVLVITCVTTASESPISFLGDSHSLVIMGLCSDLITFPDQI